MATKKRDFVNPDWAIAPVRGGEDGVGRAGLEPATIGLKGRCSTD